ncbi:WD40 repeat domain-containing serine/threonine protein kinase [Enhygromyxa salina]|uniref:Serine/threonine-protein kinase PK-1 n=1 Tax=Enhygromyxa salina TaxID=215803 RepID=A0A2S9YDT2_9BACT|nr:serine/threonine-protein kinase [Enhygromyxa salina]PRQ03192.1 Serine/threonine-protein kinase PK-1 [Enhygromyxa salina]
MQTETTSRTPARDLAASLGRQLLRQRMFPTETKINSIGRYVVLRFVGAGGMGQVFAAYDPTLDRKVALKLLPTTFGGELEQRTRLLREAQALAKLSHPNVVQVYEAGEHEGQVYVVMEFVAGQTLGEWTAGEHAEGARPSARAILDKYLQAGRGLAAAHKAGLVHRDFKPSNVIVDDDGCARVLDFGLVAGADDPVELRPVGAADASASLRALDVELTTTGTLLGTPAYMAPEQFSGAKIDARTDQFGFCVALFEALTGARPFAGSTVAELSSNVSEGRRSGSITARVRSGRLARALNRGLAADPEQRWPSMQALLDALEPRARWQVAAATAAVVLPIVGFGGWAMVDGYERQLEDQADVIATQADRADRLAIERAVLDEAGRASEIQIAAHTPGRELEALALGVEFLAADGSGHDAARDVALGGLASALGSVVPLADLAGADHLVAAVEFSADGSRLVTTPSHAGTGDQLGTTTAPPRNLDVWSTEPARKLHSIALGDLEVGHRTPAISPDGRLVAVSSGQRCVVFDLEAGERVHELDGCTDPLFAVDGRTLFARLPCVDLPPPGETKVRGTCGVAAWTLDDRTQEWARPLPERVGATLVHPDGERLIVMPAADASVGIDLLSTATGERDALLARPSPTPLGPERPEHVALSGDGRKLAAIETGGDGSVVVWDLESRAPALLELQPTGWGWYFSSPLLSHDGTELVLHGSGAGLTLYDVGAGRLDYAQSWGSSQAVALPSGWLAINEGEWFERPRAHPRQAAAFVDELVASVDGRFVASVSGGSARLWSPEAHLEVDRWSAPGRELIREFSDEVIVTQIGYGSLQVYPRAGASTPTAVDATYERTEVLEFASERPTRVVYNLDGRYEIRDLGAAAPLCQIDAHHSEGWALSSDGLTFAALDGAGGVQIWNVDTCDVRERFSWPEAEGQGELRLHFGVDRSLRARTALGLNVIRDGSGRTVRIDEQCVKEDAGWSQLSPDGRMLLSCCNSRAAEHNPGRLWDTATGELIREFDLRGYAMEAQISADNQLILINAGQREIAVVRIADGRELFRLPGRLWPMRSAKTRAGEHGLVLDLVTDDGGLVTLPLSVAGLVNAACEVLARSEFAERSDPYCGS